MPHIEVVAAVFVRDGNVLACRRAPDRPAAGQWEFPGGKVDDDEAPKAALMREIQEELGLAITVHELLDRTVTDVDGLGIDLACYFASSTVAPTSSSDHDRLRWVSIDKLDTLTWATPDLPAVAKVTARSSLYGENYRT